MSEFIRLPVLIVDDEKAIRDTLRMVLQDEGYDVLEACDGIEALAALQTTPGHIVVLLDLMMPRLDGEGVLAAVASEPKLADTHAFIVMTGNPRRLSPELTTSLAARAVPVLPKPFDLDVLFEAVEGASERLALCDGSNP